MLTITQKRSGPYGDMWITERDDEEWEWVFTILPYLLHQDLNLAPGAYPQRQSDLDLQAMPLYLCRVPTVAFFPYVTYFAGTWFNRTPTFIIPKTPLNRSDSRNWLRGLAKWPPHLVATNEENTHLTWIDTDGNPLAEGIEYREVMHLASAAQSYLLDEIRYVYDESKSEFDGTKTSAASRHAFTEHVAQFDVTREYLEWYVIQFNRFFAELLKLGRKDDRESRKRCMIAGWTVSRLAIDAITILSTDAPFVRKWQFFGFLDALASLKNLMTGKHTDQKTDKKEANEILQERFFRSQLSPALEQIAVKPIREELISHTDHIYDAVSKMKSTVTVKTERETRMKTVSGSDLLWAYRNARHGYALSEYYQEALLRHSGKIPDDLADLVIALWHYILIKFPFS